MSRVAAAAIGALLLTGCGAQDSGKKVLQRVHAEVWSQGNLAAADELYDPNYVFHATSGQDFKGRDGLKKSVIEKRAMFPDWNERLDQTVAEGDLVVTRFTCTGTHKATGKHVEVHEIGIYRLAGGKIAEEWAAGDWPEVERQLRETAKSQGN